MKRFILIFTLVFLVTLVIVATINKGKNMPGNFNINALDNAVENVTAAVSNARADTEKLVAITNKTYMNFVRPLMDIDAKLDKTAKPIYHLDSVNHSDETEKIMADILPILSDYDSDMARHRGIYQGFLDVKEKEFKNLTAPQQKLVNDVIRNFKISGIDLPQEKQARLKEIESTLSKLSNDFSNNIIAANSAFKLKVTDEKLLGEMSQSDKDANKVGDAWEFTLLAPSYTPFMTYVTDRNLRKEMYMANISKAPENENIIPEILKLREERARILGYENHAELAFENRAAPAPETVVTFLEKLARVAKPFAMKDLAKINKIAQEDKVNDLHRWDVPYYSEKLKKAEYDLDENEVKKYFELNETIKRSLELFSDMFDIEFRERKVQIWDDAAKYFDVVKDGKVSGGIYIDLSTRKTKSSGAWANDFDVHYIDSDDKKHLPVATINANFANGNPALLTLQEVSTLFHEMGHALHVLLSTTTERNQSGFNVDWDVVELPSQFLESFHSEKNVLKRISHHIENGEEMPDELIEKINKAKNFQAGMSLVRQVELGLFDLGIHTKHDLDKNDVQKTLDEVRKKIAFMPYLLTDKFQNAFSHIFAGGYSAGYYSYLWAESLSADVFIVSDKDAFSPMIKKFRDVILANGDTRPMGDLYREFAGRDPKPESLLEIYGLK